MNMRILSNWKLCPHRQALPPLHPLPSVFRSLSSILCLLLILSGCGYRFSGEGPGPQPGLQSIAIPVFENNTTEPGLEALFASALRREFILRSQLQVVPIEKAQAIMRGRIVNIYTSRVAQKQVEQTIEMRLFLTVDIRCEDARTGKVIWQYPGYTYYRTYSVSSSDPIMLFENRRRAEEFLAQEMSIRIHDRFLANF
ncbi:MAG: LptE family protein, partial [Desulfoferrobacter sp.]